MMKATNRVSGHRLETYAEALATYHLSSEMKFENGERFDSGRTERRHIRVRSIGLIGKEANKVGDFGCVVGLPNYRSTSFPDNWSNFGCGRLVDFT